MYIPFRSKISDVSDFGFMMMVAAITDLMLGMVTLLLLSRGGNEDSYSKLAGLFLAWILLFKGIEYLLMSSLQFRHGVDVVFWNVDATSLENTFLSSAYRMARLVSFMLMCFLPFVFPFRLFPKTWDAKFTLGATCAMSVVASSLYLMTDFAYFNFENAVLLPGFVILVLIYVRFTVAEVKQNQHQFRKVSIAAGLMLIAIHGETMTYWLTQVLSIFDDFQQRFFIIFGWRPSFLAWFGVNVWFTLGAASILILASGELWRTMKLGTSPFSILVFVILLVGTIAGIAHYMVLDIVRSCYEGTCQEFPEAFNFWYEFTSNSLLFLYTPILFMYVILNYNIVETKSGENRWLTRIIVVMMLLIVSSVILELVQSFLPIPELVSAAILAIIVAVFIGWEEKIVDRLIDSAQSVTAGLPIPQEDMDGGSVNARAFHYAMGGVLTYIILLSALHAGLGL